MFTWHYTVVSKFNNSQKIVCSFVCIFIQRPPSHSIWRSHKVPSCIFMLHLSLPICLFSFVKPSIYSWAPDSQHASVDLALLIWWRLLSYLFHQCASVSCSLRRSSSVRYQSEPNWFLILLQTPQHLHSAGEPLLIGEINEVGYVWISLLDEHVKVESRGRWRFFCSALCLYGRSSSPPI